VSRYSGAIWDIEPGATWDNERPYKSRGRQRARRVFDGKKFSTFFAIMA